MDCVRKQTANKENNFSFFLSLNIIFSTGMKMLMDEMTLSGLIVCKTLKVNKSVCLNT